MNKTYSMSIRVSEEELEKLSEDAEFDYCFTVQVGGVNQSTRI